ncbi:hypothetical protein C8R45DRAFT_1003328 [Mycena sanguinolenta]|nr:hypothetical protein C8R45DRAFT_1003328 [Mycena sanguinolenta]
MSAPRSIVIDDTDLSIQYGSTGWFLADPSKLNTLGNFGPLYNDTSHGTSVDATLNFPFNGTSISVLGTIAITTNANNVTDPTWDCYVDQVKIANPNPTFGSPENWWGLCDTSGLSSGFHILTINVQSNGQPFYLDQIIYTPLPTVEYDVAVVEYTNTDPAVSFGTGWQEWGVQNVTQTTGAQVALNFHGTQASLYGYVPKELPHNSTTGSYTIDGGPAIAFTLSGLTAQSATVYNNLFFQTNTLTSASHNLVVTYAGDTTKTPLAVGSFYVTNTSAPSPSNSPTSSAPGNPAQSDSTSNMKTKSSPVGAIAGGIVGCLAVLAIAIGLVFWCRRRRSRQVDSIQHTAANPFGMSATDTFPSSLPSAQYSYASVPATYGSSQYLQPETLGSPVPQPQQLQSTTMTTAYPYAPPISSSSASQLAADGRPSTSIPPSTSHAHTLSNSSANLSGTGSVHNAATGQYPTPASSVPSEGGGSVLSRKRERELATSAALATPSQMPLTPQRGERSRPTLVQQHQDSGIRLHSPPLPVSELGYIDLPPGYSAD